ncbi:hypothetical protein [Legionella shakespearei]|uniref:Uncharacterized protein n=1 Tax=Legionella shakespearei DSM 23087 TaxID=1122169 RepID=A0A0W0YLT0_9GAMM|nr:hypothetical protein [Legionella shakespearei]KTD57668.1 hypothetical protein Lsha_2509 [Legionella shakespearei DSM 23087]
MFPTAYSARIRWSGRSIELRLESDEGIKKLNIRSIEFYLPFDKPSNIQIQINTKSMYSSHPLINKFVAKDPENYEKLIHKDVHCVRISTVNHEVKESEARKLVDDFFDSLFAPNMRESFLPLYPEDLKKLQEALISSEGRYHMPSVTTTPWTPKLFAQGSVAKEAQDAKQAKEPECTWSI